jgi:hypothetical protein
MSEQKPSQEDKEIVRKAPRQDRVEAQIWGRVPKKPAALKVPKNTVDIIPKWKRFGTTKTLLRAGRPAKLEQSGKKGLGQGGDQKRKGVSFAPEFLCGDERNSQKDNHLCSTPPIRPLW